MSEPATIVLFWLSSGAICIACLYLVQVKDFQQKRIDAPFVVVSIGLLVGGPLSIIGGLVALLIWKAAEAADRSDR